MRFAALTFLFFLGLFPALAGGLDEQRSGKGWIAFHPLPTSPDYAFLRNFIESDEINREAVETWGHIDEMVVAYWDLNDDGIEEMFFKFTKATVEIFCSNDGDDNCFGFLFEKRGAQWHLIQDFMEPRIFVSDEKVKGYRNLYSVDGARYRWTGTEYDSKCPTEVPSEIPPEISQYYPSIWCQAPK
jgi:hypothetical protein